METASVRLRERELAASYRVLRAEWLQQQVQKMHFHVVVTQLILFRHEKGGHSVEAPV